jgi:hypothetical protein
MRTEETERKESENESTSHEHPDHGKEKVNVTVDGVQKTIHRGSYVVAELKAALDVDPARVLNEVIDGEFKPLDDTKRITIKGGEVFVSQVPQGGSS